MKICFYDIDLNYINYLKNYEIQKRGFTKVPNIEYASGNNKFVYGAVLNVNNINYFVPISSKDHNRQDDMLIKIKDKKGTIAGSLRFAYMIPAPASCIKVHDISKIENYTQKERCRKELAFCRKNRDKIFAQAQKTYDRIVNKDLPKLKENSCDFKLLESAYLEWMSSLGHALPDPQNEQPLDSSPAQPSQKERVDVHAQFASAKQRSAMQQTQSNNNTKQFHDAPGDN